MRLQQLATSGADAAASLLAWRALLDHAPDAVLLIAANGAIPYANARALDLLGWAADELDALCAGALFGDAAELMAEARAHGHLRRDVDILRRDGIVLPVEVHAVRLPDGLVHLACRDVREQRQSASRLEYLSTHDALTGLANRTLLRDRLELALNEAGRGGRMVGLMLIDLDRFKVVNDSLSHAAGDALLQEVGRRLVAAVRDQGMVARLGGDEFMVAMQEVRHESAIVDLAQAILAAIAQPMQAEGHELVITGSVGVAIHPRDGDSAVALMRNADLAMYRAKESGRNRIRHHAAEMNARMLARLRLEGGLRRAVELGQLELHYQPKVDLRRGGIVGAEALLRWRRDDGTVVGPDAFVPVAEDTGLIVPIGAWVLEQACRDIAAWRAAGLCPPAIAVNVSARQLERHDLPQIVGDALRRHGLGASDLQIEVTESAVMVNPARALRNLRRLHDQGIAIAMDDFGTAYSSLGYLKRFPLAILKIDRMFVRDIASDPHDAAIVALVISLGHALGMRVVAEGVETAGQMTLLRQGGCDDMQGYLFSPPVPAPRFAAMIAEGATLALDA